MDKKKLLKHIEHRINKCKDVLSYKNSEYASQQDVMSNFRNAANFLGTTPEKVAFCYMMKHFESIKSILYDNKPVTRKLYEEKMTDLINYLLLIDAMMMDKLPKSDGCVRYDKDVLE
jgi:hypothetical protein